MTEAGNEAFHRRGRDVGRSERWSDELCVAGDFNAHIGVVEPGDEESIGSLYGEEGTGKSEN